MSKKNQIHTKESITLEDILFPPSLIGKNLLIDENRIFSKEEEVDENIELYLKDKKPDFLFKAINSNPSILQGQSELKKSQYQSKNKTKKNKKVDPTTVVWESIYYWQEILYLSLVDNWFSEHKSGEDKINEKAKKLLSEIGKSLIPNYYDKKDKEYKYIQTDRHYTKDGFYHEIERKERTKESLYYQSAIGFLYLWNQIYSVFENKKSRYPSITQPLLKVIHIEGNEGKALVIKRNHQDDVKINDIISLIKETFQIELSPEIIKTFEISSIGNITASFIAYLHESRCQFCLKQNQKRSSKLKKYEIFRVGYGKFIKLKEKAEEEISSK